MQEEVAAAPRAPQQCMGLPCFPWGPARPPPAHRLELGAGFTQKLDRVSDVFLGVSSSSQLSLEARGLALALPAGGLSVCAAKVSRALFMLACGSQHKDFFWHQGTSDKSCNCCSALQT